MTEELLVLAAWVILPTAGLLVADAIQQRRDAWRRDTDEALEVTR